MADGLRGLWSFLTDADVDRLGLARDQPDILTTSSACRHLEYTRTGRRIVRASWYTKPLRRDPLWDEHEQMLQRYADVWTTLTATGLCWVGSVPVDVPPRRVPRSL